MFEYLQLIIYSDLTDIIMILEMVAQVFALYLKLELNQIFIS
jgi:hypothetical protein